MAAVSSHFDESSRFVDDLSDDSESHSSTSLSSEDDYEPIWIEKVGTKGDLFYIEPAINVEEKSEASCSYSSGKKYPTGHKKGQEHMKLKPTEKFRQWIKHRRKKIKKSFTSQPQPIARANSTKIPKVSLKNREVGEKLEVFLDVDLNRHNYGRRATIAEKLFGLVLTPSTDSPTSDEDDLAQRLIVQEVIPHGESYKEGTIKIGDWLKSVDDIVLSASNCNFIFGNLASPKKVKLVVHRFAPPDPFPTESANNYLFHHLIGDATDFEKQKTRYFHLPHAVYYLSVLKESTSQEDEDIVYSYPSAKNALSMLKGMYITLAHMISDVATPPVLSCSVVVEDVVVHVGFVVEGEQMMVLALPQSCATVSELQHFAADIAKLLKLQFSTISHAFCDCENKDYLDCFFTLFFHKVLVKGSNEKSSSKPHLLTILPSVHWFPLPNDVKIVVDDILCQYESSDFGDSSEAYYGIRRIYNILGACLFYKGYLLGSHLEKDDLLDLHLFLQYHSLLSLTTTQPVSRAIVWKEIYPSRKNSHPSHVVDPDYIEADGRYFLLIMSIRHSTMATLLEAGGCALSVSGFPSPEPFYVDQVESTLMLFEESGIYPTISKLIETQDPQLAPPEGFLRSLEKSSWEIFTSIVGLASHSSSAHSDRHLTQRSHSYSNLSAEGGKKFSEMSSILKKTMDDDGMERQQLLSHMGPADGESDEESNVVPDWSTNQRHFRRCSTSTSSNTGSHCSEENIPSQVNISKNRFSSSYDLRGYSSQDQLDNAAMRENSVPCRLLAGCQNTLFHYLHMDPAEGIFLAPTTQAEKLLAGSLGQDIIQNFHRCCLQMRTTFESSLRNKQFSASSVIPKFGINNVLQAAYEQGALFSCTVSAEDSQKKNALALSFWVLGRLFFAPEPREVYVCYHDSTQQNVVEIAFRLGFGLSL